MTFARSMTAFGRGEHAGDGVRVTVEIRSVNARFLDLIIRLPRPDVALEDEIRRRVRGTVARGRVEVFVGAEGPGGTRQVRIDADLVASYHKTLKELARKFDLSDELSLSTLTRLPGVISFDEGSGTQSVPAEAAMNALDQALISLVEMRAAEGRVLVGDMTERLQQLDALAADIARRAPAVTEEYRQRLRQRLERLGEEGQVDEARLAGEVAILAERADITEELVRLRSHGEQAAAILTDATPSKDGVGRRLDFLFQEMNRELNTIASKAGDLEVARLVVAARAEVEKLREQTQNLE